MRRNKLLGRISALIMAAMLAFSSMPINAYAEDGQEVNIESQEDEKEQNDTVSCDAIVEPTEETDTTESVSNDSINVITDESIEVTENLECEEYLVEEDIQLSTEYPMIMDKVEGSNIETFYIERPDPEALKNNVVNASVFGLSVSDDDNYTEFSAALDYCKEHPNTYLVIDKGVYHFKTDATLKLTGLNNVLIDGNGAEFIFETQKQFSFEGCDGVELRNLIVDWNWEDNRIASFVRIRNKNKNAKTFEVEFLEQDEVDEDIPLVCFQQYDSKDHVPGSYGGWKTFYPEQKPGSIVDVEKIEPNVLKIYYGDPFTTDFHNEDVFILRHYTYGGAVFSVGGGSKNITFNNVSIYGSAGMGYVFGGKANHFQLINSYIGIRPGSGDKYRMSTTADGIHILNTDGYFRIDNCDLSYTGDDIMNIHDDMLKITNVDSTYKLTGYVTGGFVEKGDKIRLYNKNMKDIGFETEVESFSRKSNTGTLLLKDPLPADIKGYYVYRSSSSTHNYVVSNNYIHETKGRAALLNASDALYENNRMYRTVSECVQVRVDLSERDESIYYEGIGAKNVVINNNVFEECAFGDADNIITIDCNVGNNKNVLSDVWIINNQFNYCYGAKETVITVDNISDLHIENNIISDCSILLVNGNRVYNPVITISDYCGAVYEKGNNICYPSISCEHTDTKQVQDRQPGCYEYGSTGVTYCNQCHTIIASYKGIPPCKHNYIAVISDTSGGKSIYHKCSVCGILENHDTNGTGGSCSVCEYGKNVSVGYMSLELDKKNVDFIGINLYVDAPSGTVFYVDGNKVEADWSNDNGLYKLQYKCAPKELSDKHILTAKDSSNKSININNSTEYMYSGDTYCRYVASHGSSYSMELKNVCSSLLTYSEQARSYFEYNDDGLVAGDVSANIPSSGYSMKVTGALPDGCGYIGSSLILGDEVRLRHYFAVNDSKFTVTCVNITKKDNTSVNIGYTDASSIMYVDIKVPYSSIGDMYELKISTSASSSSYTLCYGVLTYCNKARELNADSDLTNLCNALYNFSVAVSSY